MHAVFEQYKRAGEVHALLQGCIGEQLEQQGVPIMAGAAGCATGGWVEMCKRMQKVARSAWF